MPPETPDPKQPQDQEPQNNEGATPEQGGADPRKNIQARLNQLYGQNKQLKEQLSATAQTSEQLQSQLLSMQEKLALLESQQARPSTPAPDPFGFERPQQSGTPLPSQDWQKNLRGAIEEVVGPTLAELKQARQAEQLRAEQARNFSRVMQRYPELADPNSPLTVAVAEMLQRDPSLGGTAHGPELAVLAARGLLAEEEHTRPQPPAPGTYTPPTGSAAVSAEAKSEVAQLKKELADTQAKMWAEPNDVEAAKLFTLRTKLKKRLFDLGVTDLK